MFEVAGLTAFPVSQMLKNGGDWPTVNYMIQKNQRLLVFTSDPTKVASEGIAYQWSYVVENQCMHVSHILICIVTIANPYDPI